MLKGLLSSGDGICLLLFPIRLVVCCGLERFFTAHKFRQWSVIFLDLATTLFLISITLRIANKAIALMNIHAPIPAAIAAAPIAVRVALFLVLADFTHYWIHRLMHHPLLWRIHKWHHSPTHMSWAAGNRESLPDAILVNSGYAFLWPIVGSIPNWVGVLLMLFAILKNDWMHLNVNWRLPWIEWLVVTPRFHHIHHSANPSHYNSNFSPAFSIWDRIFGTYTNPAVEKDSLAFGIGERPPIHRLALGI